MGAGAAAAGAVPRDGVLAQHIGVDDDEPERNGQRANNEVVELLRSDAPDALAGWNFVRASQARGRELVHPREHERDRKADEAAIATNDMTHSGILSAGANTLMTSTVTQATIA